MTNIFLISLPRSGSTLLQHILGNHSNIAASAEPWVLFPNLLTLRKNAFYAKYQPEIGQIALNDFLAQVDGKEQVYYDAVRKYADHMYKAFLQKSGKEYFLDKTSRYYLALPELYKVYPDAKYIFLLRNPLSVLASFIENMVNGDLKGLGKDGIKEDLMEGYQILMDQISNKKVNACTINYESLIIDPESEVKKLCQFIGVDFEPEMLNYGGNEKVLYGKLVDPKSIHKHATPVKDYLNTWKKVLDNSERKNFAYDYLKFLGGDLINCAGYDYKELLEKCSSGIKGKRRKTTFEKVMLRPLIVKKGYWSDLYQTIKDKKYKLTIYKSLKPLLNIK